MATAGAPIAGSRLRAAAAVLWAEAACVNLWPAAALLAAFAAAALLGLPAMLPWPVHVALLVAWALGVVVLLRRAPKSWRRPTRQAAERRLEHDSGLPHQPFGTLRDRPATGSDGEALWVLHQSRSRAALARVTLLPPHPDMPRHDRQALRAAALLLLVTGLVVAGPRAGSRLAAALLPGLPAFRTGAEPSIQAWIQPPAYTGVAPVFLPPGGSLREAPVTVPAGSRLTLSVTGLFARPGFSVAGHGLDMQKLGEQSFEASKVLTESGQVRLGGRFSSLAEWTLALLPNEPPSSAWSVPPGRAGTSLSTRLPWRVQQRWGVAHLDAEFFPRGRPDLPALRILLPLPGTPRQASGSAVTDLSADPYAGVALTGRLNARDVSGQHGQSEPADIVLPARVFHHPLARAIADLRRRLALHPEDRAEAADELLALAGAPLAKTVQGLTASGVALNLAAAAARLAAPETSLKSPNRSDPRDLEVQARLWTLALALDGALPEATAQALAEARESLRQGIEEHARGTLSDKALGEKLDALRQALDKRLADLAARAMQQGALQKFDPHSQHLSAPALDRLMRQLEQALREGRAEDAMQKLAELELMTDQLKNAHIMTPEESRQQQEQARQGRQQMGAVQDMVQREGALLDHAQSRVPAQPPAEPPGLSDSLTPSTDPMVQDGIENPVQNLPPFAPPSPDVGAAPSPPNGSPPSGARSAPTRQADARIQRAIRRALNALKDGLTESGRKKPASLDDGERAMQDAASALQAQDDAQARDAMARAIAALQQGGQDMARQGAQQSGAGLQLSLQPGGQPGEDGEEGQDGTGDGQGGTKRDPFGRPVDGSGTTADDPGLRVPDQMEQGRSRAIQEELRRRGGDRTRKQGELDYIGRLLKPF